MVHLRIRFFSLKHFGDQPSVAPSVLLDLPAQLPLHGGWPVWRDTLVVFGSFFVVVSLLALRGVLWRNIIELIRAGRQPKANPTFSRWQSAAGLLLVAALAALREIYPASPDSPMTTALEPYQRTVGSLGLVLFIGVFVSLVFFAASGSLLYFLLFTEIEEDRKYFRRLQQLGTSAGEDDSFSSDGSSLRMEDGDLGGECDPIRLAGRSEPSGAPAAASPNRTQVGRPPPLGQILPSVWSKKGLPVNTDLAYDGNARNLLRGFQAFSSILVLQVRQSQPASETRPRKRQE